MAEQQRGYIVPVGGAEEKIGDVAILRRFAALCGGPACRIAIIPTASELAETGARYEELFHSLGVKVARSLPIASRADCERPEWLAVLDEVEGIFLTGGNQLRLSTMIGGTPVAKAIRRRNRGGRARGRHLGRSGIPLRAHDRVRQGRLLPAGEDRDPRAGPGSYQPDHHRPAFPPA